jgi:hypothetical protein
MTDVAAPNERDPEIHEAFLTLACAIFCFSIERVTRINSLKVRFLGDKVPERTAWKVADQLRWETTYDAEFVALTQLQADVFITSDGNLARAVSGLVKTATIDALRTA